MNTLMLLTTIFLGIIASAILVSFAIEYQVFTYKIPKFRLVLKNNYYYIEYKKGLFNGWITSSGGFDNISDAHQYYFRKRSEYVVKKLPLPDSTPLGKAIYDKKL
jgi:hypothetical protein